MSEKPVRVRIAPSPTGDPHVGTAYVALFNYAFAKKHRGQFVLRIEDTDRSRARHDSEQMIMECLKWTGLQWDEGPDVGGPHAPYRQSERTEIYQNHANQLLELGHAYRCFCTPQRLEELRQTQIAQKVSLGYDKRCRHLSSDEVKRKVTAGEAFTIRAKFPSSGTTVVHDRLRGAVEFQNDGIDDQVLLKSDGFPTYHLANVVDDHCMGISHVIRAEEWITSTPKHVLLYDFFGWDKPEFIHLPLLRNSDKSKISKRKNPTSINYYKRKGIVPEAFTNFLALMGWNMGDDKEIFSLKEMVDNFSWDHFSLGAPVFDMTKLVWLNGHYLRNLSDHDYLEKLYDVVFAKDYMQKIIPLIKTRIEKFEDFVGVADFFFAGDLTYTKESLLTPGRTAMQNAEMLSEVLDKLETIDGWSHTQLHDVVQAYGKEKGIKAKDLFMPVRIAVTGRKESPPLFETMEVLGKEIVRRRMRLASQFLQNQGEA